MLIAKLLSRDFVSYVSKWERMFESEISRQQKAGQREFVGETQIVAQPLARFRLVRNSGQTALFAWPCLAHQFTEETIKRHFLVGHW